MDIQKAMKQAQAMQQKMSELHQEMGVHIVSGESGGGMVKITSTCKGEVKSIDIDKQLLKEDEKEVLEDLIIAAFKNAKSNADQKMNERMGEVAGKMGLPPEMLNMGF